MARIDPKLTVMSGGAHRVSRQRNARAGRSHDRGLSDRVDFRLPMTQAQRAPCDVLIVDDDADALDEMRDALSRANLSVVTAEGAAEALQRLREMDVGVVVTDIRMPDISGMMLAALVRDEFKEDPPELIFISGYAEREVVIESIRHAPSGFLLKPVDMQELLVAVFRALGARSARRASERPRGGADFADKAARDARAGQASGELSPDRVLALLRQEREVREELFHPDVASTPAWQLILDLYRVEREGGHNYVSSIALSSGLPLTTALRYIDQLVALGYVERMRDSADARRIRVTLTPTCNELFARYSDEIARRGATPR